jgi:hypothetical protein
LITVLPVAGTLTFTGTAFTLSVACDDTQYTSPGESVFLIFNSVNKTVTTLYGLLFGTYSLEGSDLTITLNPAAVTGATSISGTASVAGGNLTLAEFSGTPLTMTLSGAGSQSFSANDLNAAYSPDGPFQAITPVSPSGCASLP